MKIIITIALFGLLLLPGNALSADPVGQVPVASVPLDRTVDTQAVRRWQQLSPEQQQSLRERYRQYQQLSTDEQQRLRQSLQRFNAMDPQQQQRIQERFKQWQALPAEQREQIRQTYQDFSELTPEQQSQLRQEFDPRKDIPETQRPERTESLRHNDMGDQSNRGPAVGMPRSPVRRMGH
jgi:membrane protein involved in colicin uptake